MEKLETLFFNLFVLFSTFCSAQNTTHQLVFKPQQFGIAVDSTRAYTIKIPYYNALPDINAQIKNITCAFDWGMPLYTEYSSNEGFFELKLKIPKKEVIYVSFVLHTLENGGLLIEYPFTIELKDTTTKQMGYKLTVKAPANKVITKFEMGKKRYSLTSDTISVLITGIIEREIDHTGFKKANRTHLVVDYKKQNGEWNYEYCLKEGCVAFNFDYHQFVLVDNATFDVSEEVNEIVKQIALNNTDKLIHEGLEMRLLLFTVSNEIKISDTFFLNDK